MRTLKAHLQEAKLSDYPTIQNMARFYVYDMSRYCGHLPGWECPDDGLFENFDLKPYFCDNDHYAFLILVGQEKAGFAMINKIGTTPDVDWNMGEFFVLAKFQGKGIAEQAAKLIFAKFKGRWEVATMPPNIKACKFWVRIIGASTGKSCRGEEKIVGKPAPHPMIVINFVT
jgi:predicted acetyltransferase